jgi:hypothetical protein
LSTPDPAADPTPAKSPYPVPLRTLQAFVLTLPRPPADAPDAAWNDTVQDGLDKLAALDPSDAIEAMFAIDLVALNTGLLDALRLAFEPAATQDLARLQRASAVALHRSVAGSMRLLDHQRRRPAAPERDWAGAVPDLTAAWRAAPPRPLAAPHGTAAAADDEVVVKWIDEIDDKELVIAIEQERREKSGLPELPRKPGTPKVIYRYKPEDYIHKFKPDPKNFQPYPGWENMTMSERRDFFGYHYDGPLGPPDALTPASRDAMLAEMAADEILKEEYGM